MGVATVSFRKCVFNSPPSEKDGTQRNSQVIFDLEVDGVHYQGISADVSYLLDPEITKRSTLIPELHGYDSLLNHEVLQASIEFYLRQVPGWQDAMANSNKKCLGLNDWAFERDMVVQFEI